MTRNTNAGFTLVELITAVALTAVLTGAMAALVLEARQGAAVADSRGRELVGFQRAMRLLTADLRAAQGVARDGGTITIRTAEGARSWSARDGALVRTAGDVTETVATSVRGVEVEPDAPLFRVRLRVGTGTTLRTAVLPRTEVTG